MFNVQLSCKFKPTTGQCAGLIRNTTTLRIKFIQNTECPSWEVQPPDLQGCALCRGGHEIGWKDVFGSKHGTMRRGKCKLHFSTVYPPDFSIHEQTSASPWGGWMSGVGGGYKEALKVVGVHTNMLHPLKIWQHVAKPWDRDSYWN